MKTPPAPNENSSDREIVISRLLDAPRELVWEAWTNPKHVAQWWGPRGFTTETEVMDVRTGGTWKHVMVGPDGARYPNKSLFKEVVKPERIVYSHGGGREEGGEGKGATFTATWTFEEVAPGQTRLTGRMVFPSKDTRDFVAKEFGAVEGGKQTLEKLSEFLPSIGGPAPKEFILVRKFDAPRELVWQALTEPERLKQWFTPKGFTMPKCAMDLRPGGTFHYCMRTPDGHEMWGRWIIREVVAPEKLVVIVSFSDANGGVTRHPMSATWPLETLSTTTLEEQAGQTWMKIRWESYKATDEERKTFDNGHDSMRQGWGGTMDQLDAYLRFLRDTKT